MSIADVLEHRASRSPSTNSVSRELASWIIVASLLEGNPDLGVAETHPGHPGEYDCLSVFDRTKLDRPPVLDLDRQGVAHVAPLTGGAHQWEDIWESCGSLGPVAVARELADRAMLPSPVRHDGVEALTINQLVRRMLKLHEARIAGTWECRNGIADSSEGATRRLEYFEQVPAGLERLATAPESVFGDPAYGFWFLLRDGVPVSCLDIYR